MIDIYRGELLDILPSNLSYDTKVRALSAALRRPTREFVDNAKIIRLYADLDRQPENIVDAMAGELRTQYYEQTWPLDIKREVVRHTLEWYMHAGTPSAVRELIDVVFGEGDVIEWADYTEPPYDPWTFDIVTGAQMTPDILDQFTHILQNVKRESAHLRRVLVKRRIDALWYIGAGMVAEDHGHALNHYQIDRLIEGSEFAGTAVNARQTIKVDNVTALDPAELQGLWSVGGALCATPRSAVDNNAAPGEETAQTSLYGAAAAVSRNAGSVDNNTAPVERACTSSIRASAAVSAALREAAFDQGYQRVVALRASMSMGASACLRKRVPIIPMAAKESASINGAFFVAMGIQTHAHCAAI